MEIKKSNLIRHFFADKLRNYALNFEAMRYLLVGGLNVIFTFLIFTGSLLILKLHYLLALTLSWMLGILLTYILNYTWVFKPEKQFRFQERFIKYFLTNFLSFISNLIALHYIVAETNCAPFYAQLAMMPIIIAVNFMVAKFWSMKRALQ